MSYRSIKHVLGETSLERKCRFLFGACLLLLITASFWLYGKRTNKIIDEQNRNNGRMLVDQEMAFRHWKRLEATKENSDYRDIVKMLAKSFNKQRYDVRFILPNLPAAKDGGPDGLNPIDNFELAAVKRFLKDSSRPLQPRTPTSLRSGSRPTATSTTTTNRSTPRGASASPGAISR